MSKELMFTTKDIFMTSPTYHNRLEDEFKDIDYPFVNMEADVSFETNHDSIEVGIINRLWKDPEAKENEDGGEHFSLTIDLTIEDVIHIKSFLDAFIETRKLNRHA